MTPVFLDTSYLLALVVESDENHARALAWRNALRVPFVTTEFVLIELADGLSKRATRHLACGVIDSIRMGRGVTVVKPTRELILRGYTLYKRSRDKSWSLTDCISFELMYDRHLTDALTHDHHFEQARLRALLRSDPPSN
jgi:uncharacterized protein